MELSIGKAELQKGLARIQAIVEKRNSMPILANVLMEASLDGDQGILILSATDLEVGIRGEQEAVVETAGSVTVGAKKLFEIVRELPEDDIQLKVTSNNYLDIRCQRSHFTLAGTASDEYPTLPDFSPEKTVSVPSDEFAMMIERTMYAASIDETRYNLNGVYLEILPETGKLRMVATDGHRLAMAEKQLPGDLSSLSSGLIIPRKGLVELKRMLDEDDAQEVELAFEGNSGLAKKGGFTLVIRLIEGEFPNYNQVIPSEIGVQVVLPVERFVQALRRVVLLSSERSRAVKLTLSEGEIVVSSSNPDLGDATDEFDVEYSGETITIGFNARYVLDALNALHVKEVRFGLQGELSPAQFRASEDDDSLAVVMPMRI